MVSDGNAKRNMKIIIGKFEGWSHTIPNHARAHTGYRSSKKEKKREKKETQDKNDNHRPPASLRSSSKREDSIQSDTITNTARHAWSHQLLLFNLDVGRLFFQERS